MKRKDRAVSLAGRLLTIRQGEKTARYCLNDVGSPDARHGFQLEKVDEDGRVLDVYDVELFTVNGYHGCTCHGFVAHGHCKHTESLLALIEAGKLGGRRSAEVA